MRTVEDWIVDNKNSKNEAKKLAVILKGKNVKRKGIVEQSKG